jgi:hypothetical protein
MQQLIEQYIACWNERDPDQRQKLLGPVDAHHNQGRFA